MKTLKFQIALGDFVKHVLASSGGFMEVLVLRARQDTLDSRSGLSRDKFGV